MVSKRSFEIILAQPFAGEADGQGSLVVHDTGGY
jgi:hypothetical protein